MFVITADQRASRTDRDLVPAGIRAARDAAGSRLAGGPERTAGDELQLATVDPAAALEVVLRLTRLDSWSVGLGFGEIESPLPEQVRAGRGDAFVHARDAVERAKRAPTRLAVTGPDDRGDDAEALIRLLVEVRDRRTPEGWEVYDLLAEGLTQRDAAERLDISEGAVSLRAKAAGLRSEEAAVPALVRLLGRADGPSGEGRTPVED